MQEPIYYLQTLSLSLFNYGLTIYTNTIYEKDNEPLRVLYNKTYNTLNHRAFTVNNEVKCTFNGITFMVRISNNNQLLTFKNTNIYETIKEYNNNIEFDINDPWKGIRILL